LRDGVFGNGFSFNLEKCWGTAIKNGYTLNNRKSQKNAHQAGSLFAQGNL